MPPAPTVFISYSHKDEVWKDRLVKHLAVLQNQGHLETWDDRRIRAGEDWLEEIRKGMAAARVALFLVSADSLTSDFILHTEIPHLLERREREGMTVFPVICTDCLWEEVAWLAKLQARPKDGQALASYRGNRVNAELKKIAQEILTILRNGAPHLQPVTTANLSRLATLAPLHQLPTPPADFTGREEDLEFLRSRLAEGGTGAIFGLRGMGGVGKTTLALKLAEELKPRFPDAQIYLDLKGVDPQPLTAAQAMAHVIRSFHPEARLPESEAELAPLYRSVLDNKRVLLLMDNAARDKKQVEPLIPPVTCLLLVTSRFRFSLPGLVERGLGKMVEKEAIDLLLTISPRIGETANEIVRLCGCLPLALRLAGSALEERPDLSPSAYARQLSEGTERLEPVEASLKLSYNLLTEEQRQRWRFLAVFPGTFDAEAVAAIWELSPLEAINRLGEFIKSSLVEWESHEKRYRLHDLAREFAQRQLASFSELISAEEKHAEFFFQKALDIKALQDAGSGDKAPKMMADLHNYVVVVNKSLTLILDELERIDISKPITTGGDHRGESISDLLIHFYESIITATGEPVEQVIEGLRTPGDQQLKTILAWVLGRCCELIKHNHTHAALLMQIRVDYERKIGHPDAEKHAAHVAALRARIAEQKPES